MAIYYVDPLSGSDAAAGTSFGTAWATTQKAADTAVAGDEVRLCATATETPAAQIDWDTNAGTATSFITFVGADATGTPLTTGYYTISGSSLPPTTNLFYWDATGASQYVRFKHIRLTGATNHNVRLGPESGSNVITALVFENCRFDSATVDGIRQGYGIANQFVNCEVDNNGGCGYGPSGSSIAARNGFLFIHGGSIHNNGSAGAVVINDRNIITSSLIYSNGGSGVELGRFFQYGLISNNTIYGNTGSGIGDAGHSFLGQLAGQILGNSFVSNSLYGLENNRGSNVTAWIDYNHYYNNTSGETDFTGGTPGDNNQSGDPLFTSVSGGSEDFTPTSGSPLIRTYLNQGNIGAVANTSAGGGGGGATAHTFAC